jgi:hypothetical protein
MKSLCSVLAALLFWGISVSKVKAQDPENYFINRDGVKVVMMGEVSLDAQYLYYNNEKGKRQSIAQKKVKLMVANGREFLNLPITAHMKRLQEVIAYDKDYVLTVYYQGFQYAYVWDKKYNPVIRKMTLSGKQKKLEKQIAEMEQFLKCSEVYNKMRANLQANKPACEGISGFSCDDSDMPQGTSGGDDE